MWFVNVWKRNPMTCGTMAVILVSIGIPLATLGVKSTALGVGIVLGLWCATGCMFTACLLGLRYLRDPSLLRKDICGQEPTWSRRMIITIASVVAMVIATPYMLTVDHIATHYRRLRIKRDDKKRKNGSVT